MGAKGEQKRAGIKDERWIFVQTVTPSPSAGVGGGEHHKQRHDAAYYTWTHVHMAQPLQVPQNVAKKGHFQPIFGLFVLRAGQPLVRQA